MSFSKKDVVGDFIPHKSAVRIRDMVMFSVKLDCGAPELK
jgi:hypothetical protein